MCVCFCVCVCARTYYHSACIEGGVSRSENLWELLSLSTLWVLSIELRLSEWPQVPLSTEPGFEFSSHLWTVKRPWTCCFALLNFSLFFWNDLRRITINTSVCKWTTWGAVAVCMMVRIGALALSVSHVSDRCLEQISYFCRSRKAEYSLSFLGSPKSPLFLRLRWLWF